MSRLKMVPWALGVVLLAGSLVGANRLLHADSTSPGGGGGANGKPPAGPAPGSDALIVHGTVAAAQELVPYAGSPFLASGQVAEVYVKEGQEVKAGQPLYKFDDAAAQADIREAAAAVELARRKQDLAEYQKKTEKPILIEKAKVAVSAAETQRDLAQQGVDTATESARKEFTSYGKDPQLPKLSNEEIEHQVRTNPNVLRAQSQLAQAQAAVKEKQLDLQRAEKSPAEEQVKEATAAVDFAEVKLAKARLVADYCVVRAKVGGVVERVEAAPGLVIGPTSRGPLLWLVPTGPRVVRAEVVPEYSFKIQNRIGQRVTIMDDNSPNLTYEGEVKRVGGSFLPKRTIGGADLLTGKASLALEVEVEVKDPAPPGKPPLRVGQPVRVSIGQ